MKKLFVLLFFFFALSMIAAEFPKHWEYRYWNSEDKSFLKINSPQSPELKLISNINSGNVEIPQQGINLNQSAKGYNSAIFRGYVQSDKQQILWLGLGCRIFGVFVNGKIVYDMRWKGLGNDYFPVTANDHVIALPLNVGKNEIVITTKRTNYLQDYCYGANRKIEWRLVMKPLKNYEPVKAELAHPEMILRPNKGSFIFSFVTKHPVPAAIDYRVKGTEKWIREWDLAGDFILREKSRIHRIRINDIPAGKDVEYRIVMLEPPAGKSGMRRALWTALKYKEVVLPVKTLRNPDRKNFSFFVFGDTQLSLSTTCRTVADRQNFMKRMREIPEFQKSDFIVHIGDENSYFHSVERDLLTNLFDDFAPEPGKIVKPWVLVRGNHDANGIAAEDWYDYFQMPDDKSYYSFRLGDVLIISLDCGDFPSSSKFSSFNGPLNNLNILMERQKKWLENLQKSPAYRTAKYRIILCHSEPQISGYRIEKRIRKLTAPLLQDQSKDGLIHFWIAGHVHRYWRAARGSTSMVARQPRKKPILKVSPVNWVSLDGPKGNSAPPNFSYLWVNVSDNQIYVKAIDENGKKFDEFTIDPTGKFKELYRSDELKSFPLK